MSLHIGKKFWIAATAGIVVVAFFLVGRNLMHAMEIRRQINALNREKDYYQTRIKQDSTLLEQLQYDDYLEQYAREHFRMQRPEEHIYILKDSIEE